METQDEVRTFVLSYKYLNQYADPSKNYKWIFRWPGDPASRRRHFCTFNI